MKLTDDRIAHITHLLIDRLYRDDMVDYPHDDDTPAVRAAKKIIIEYCQLEERASETARQMIRKQKKNIPEGSREWDILFRKYAEAELNRLLPR